MNHEIITHIEHELAKHHRNQVAIDSLRRPTTRDRLMLHLHDNFRRYFWLGYFAYLFLFCFGAAAFAEEAQHPACPDNQPCKIIYLNQQEERLLTGQNGILDTAAQGRALDLGQFAVYLKQKIAGAPAGEIKAAEKPAAEGNPAK